MIASFFLLAAGAPAATAPPVGPVSVPTNVTVLQPTWGSEHTGILYAVQVLFIISVIGLITLMSIQTTKTEGLSGSIGGRMESAYKGRLGLEQQLARVTTVFAVAFMFFAILDFIITR